MSESITDLKGLLEVNGQKLSEEDYDDVKDMSNQEFRFRVINELRNMRRQNRWIGIMNGALLSVMIGVGIAILTMGV